MSDPESFTFTIDDHGIPRAVTIDADMCVVLEGASPFIQTGVVMLEKRVALHRAVYAKRHGIELSAVPPLIRHNEEKLDCRTSNLGPRPPKRVPPNLVSVPDDEMRSVVTEYGEILEPLLIPAKYADEARQVGIRQSPDKSWRRCRVCQKPISMKEDFLAILIQRRENSPPTKGFMHINECMPRDQEVPESLPLRECRKRQNEYMKLHPELFPMPESDSDESSQSDSDDFNLEGFHPEMVHVSTGVKKPCPLCDDVEIGGESFEQSCNHLILGHGLVCLHVGSETHKDEETGFPIHSTVAVFGRNAIHQRTD